MCHFIVSASGVSIRDVIKDHIFCLLGGAGEMVLGLRAGQAGFARLPTWWFFSIGCQPINKYKVLL
jgi:hypothetical protein